MIHRSYIGRYIGRCIDRYMHLNFYKTQRCFQTLASMPPHVLLPKSDADDDDDDRDDDDVDLIQLQYYWMFPKNGDIPIAGWVINNGNSNKNN